MSYVIPVAPPVTLPIAGSDGLFPVRRVFCIGKNYSEHVREMGGDPQREEPLFFAKPADTVVGPGAAVPYPPGTRDLHFEVELVAALGRDVPADATVDTVRDTVMAYGIGIDLTRRDLQAEAKKRGRPWDMSKGFDACALCSALEPVERIGHPQIGEIGLDLDDTACQRGDLRDMVWPVADMLVALNALISLKAGDLLYCGTPSGVGPVVAGQTMTVWAEGVARESWTVS